MGAVGDDLLTDFLISVLGSHRVKTHLAGKEGRRAGLGDDPAYPRQRRATRAAHAGATPMLTEADVDLPAIAAADVLHVGGPDVLGQGPGQPGRAGLRPDQRGPTP
jgi:sugar/nucleoside kinase (ribokinase family)